jgi:ATP-dependent RNA helicase DDX47/RRP3
MVTQYDVEIYQRLEGLLCTKLPAYNIAPEETVLILLERVNDAQRLATRELKEQLSSRDNRGGGGRRKRRNGDDDDDGADTEGGGSNMAALLQKELKRGGYKGGSGGAGGALKNQRGSGQQTKKYRRK